MKSLEILETQLQNVLEKLEAETVGTEDYKNLLLQAKTLHGMIGEEKGRYDAVTMKKMQSEVDLAKIKQADKDSKRKLWANAIMVGGTLTGIVTTIMCEETRVVTSKAWGFVSKMLPKAV